MTELPCTFYERPDGREVHSVIRTIRPEDAAWFINAKARVSMEEGASPEVRIIYADLGFCMEDGTPEEVIYISNGVSCEDSMSALRKQCEEYLDAQCVFVFGSNEAGIHGAGAAKAALKKGAVLRKAEGHWGNTYAIPTKSPGLRTLNLAEIEEYVASFIDYAIKHPELQFQITQIGCGLAGLKPEQIAPMFRLAPQNCWFDKAWFWMLPDHKSWGTF